MKLWPTEYILRMGASVIMSTCFMFTFVTLCDHFILKEEQTSKEMISTLFMALLLAIIFIFLERKKWKEKLAQIRSGKGPSV